MKTALIILNYNAYKDLVSLTNSLIETIDEKKFSIIVIDNNSLYEQEYLDRYFISLNALFIEETSSLKAIRQEKLIYIKLKENKGYSHGNNIGLKIASDLSFKFAFIINPDIEIPNFEIFDDAINIFVSNEQIGIIGFRVILPNGKNQGPFRYKLGWDLVLRNLFFPFYSIIKNVLWFIEKRIKGYINIPCVVGCFLGINLKHLKTVDFYDENVFLYYEEQIISERMLQFGFKTVYRDNYYVNHNHIYKDDLGSNPFFVVSKDYYVNTYIKPSAALTKMIKISQKYFEVIWKGTFMK